MKMLRAIIFSPFAIVYGVILKIRHFLFDKKILPSSAFELFTISVGNISLGGTGKTPMVGFLIHKFEESGFLSNQIAVLTRGYKRKRKGSFFGSSTMTAEEIGDEPAQIINRYPSVQLFIDADRRKGMSQIIRWQPNVKLVILDDAFQHRYVDCDVNIVLTQYGDLYSSDFLFPSGNLRDVKSALKRAHIIVVSKCPENITDKEKQRIKHRLKPNKDQKLYFSYIEYLPIKSNTCEAFEIPENASVLLVTGIANPRSLRKMLKDKYTHFRSIQYPDHHFFTEMDIQKIKKEFESMEAPKFILTTEKDYMRMVSSNYISEDFFKNIYYQPIETKICGGKKEENGLMASILANR